MSTFSGGAFTDTGFANDAYNVGIEDTTTKRQRGSGMVDARSKHWDQLLKEDEELLEFITRIVTSELLH